MHAGWTRSQKSLPKNTVVQANVLTLSSTAYHLGKKQGNGTMNDPMEKLRAMRELAYQGGGRERVQRQHERGKLTARERVVYLLDEGKFQELGTFAMHDVTDFGMDKQRYPGDGVVTGFGTINNRRVAIFAQDFTVLGGSFSETQSHKICRIQDMALESGIPLIGLIDSSGARIQEGVRSLSGYGEMFTRNVLASGVIPQISVMLGPCAGGSVYSPALTDFILMVRDTSFMFSTGPEVIRSVTGMDVTAQELGGADVHNSKSGMAHFVADTDREVLDLVRLLLSYLPQNNTDDPPRVAPYDNPARQDEALNKIVPLNDDEPYDMHRVLDAVFDRGSFLEVHYAYAHNAIVGFAHLDGYVVGVVANQPAHLAGVLDIDSSDKISRFVRICDAYNIPLITIVDSPGILPGVAAEHRGAIRHAAKIIYAYCEATVPKISIVTRKAIGGAYIAMSSRTMRSDLAYAWPTAQIAVMGPSGAVRILEREALARADDPSALEKQFVEQYREKFYSPYSAAQRGQIDEVIEPGETRQRLILALEILRTKVQHNPPKKHGLMPV
jgi:acetyl-CoA carboxylase carboxyltransferase component